MEVFVEIGPRTLSAAVPSLLSQQLSFVVNTVRREAMGGPKECSVTAYGSINALFELLEHLRAPLYLYDERGRDVWWGYVAGINVRLDSLELSVDLDYMYNKVRVEYTEKLPGTSAAGDRFLTAWAEDTISIGTYGTRELTESKSDLTAEAATAVRDGLLSMMRYPNTSWTMSGADASMSATIYGRGWGETMDWQHYSYNQGFVQHTVDGEGFQNWGNVGFPEMAQGFQFGGTDSWTPGTAEFKLKTKGNPTDNVVLEIQTDASGEPSGTVLTSGSIAASEIKSTYEWARVVLSPDVTLSPSTPYWLVATRSGAPDNDNYYTMNMDEGLGYPNGSFLRWNTTDWVVRTVDADALFRITAKEETTQQVVEMIASAAQFITGVTIEEGSGIETVPYYDGEQTVKSILEDILEMGTSDGRRLLYTITKERWLRIFAEPQRPGAGDSVDYHITTTGRIMHHQSLVDHHMVPVGVWADVVGFIPDTLDLSKLQKPGLAFIEGFEYDFRDLKAMLYPRVAPSPWDVL